MPDTNYRNYNGYADAKAAITVPKGYAVTVELESKDTVMAHSAGISAPDAHNKPLPDPTPTASFTLVASEAGNQP